MFILQSVNGIVSSMSYSPDKNYECRIQLWDLPLLDGAVVRRSKVGHHILRVSDIEPSGERRAASSYRDNYIRFCNNSVLVYSAS